MRLYSARLIIEIESDNKGILSQNPSLETM